MKNEHGVEHKVAFRMAAQAWKWVRLTPFTSQMDCGKGRYFPRSLLSLTIRAQSLFLHFLSEQHPMNAANRSLGRTEPEKQYSDNEQRQQEANNQEPQKVLEQESGQLKMQGSREESEREGVTEVSSAECQQ